MTTDEIMKLADAFSYAAASAKVGIHTFGKTSLLVKDKLEKEDETRAALLKAVEELARDAARINFLESTKKEHTLCLGSTWYSRSGYSQPITKHKTLRDAIDAAMKEAA